MDEKSGSLRTFAKIQLGVTLGVHKTTTNVMKMAYALHVCSLEFKSDSGSVMGVGVHVLFAI